jgi:hypothetical protein
MRQNSNQGESHGRGRAGPRPHGTSISVWQEMTRQCTNEPSQVSRTRPHLAREIGRRIISDGQVRESIRWACICPRHHHCCCGRLNNYCGPTKEESSLPTRLDRPAHHLPGGLLSLSLSPQLYHLALRVRNLFSHTSTRTNTAIRHYGRNFMCRRPAHVPTAKCRGRRHRGPRRPATELTVGARSPSAHCCLHRRSPSAQTGPSAQKLGARRSPSAQPRPSADEQTGGPSR